MNIIYYFIKEILIKLIIVFILFILFLIIITIKSKILFLFILSPIKKIKITNLFFIYNTENIKEIYCELKNNITIPIIEINLPFFSTSYIYIKYILLFTCYLFIPILIYILFININIILRKQEFLVALVFPGG